MDYAFVMMALLLRMVYVQMILVQILVNNQILMVINANVKNHWFGCLENVKMSNNVEIMSIGQEVLVFVSMVLKGNMEFVSYHLKKNQIVLKIRYLMEFNAIVSKDFIQFILENVNLVL